MLLQQKMVIWREGLPDLLREIVPAPDPGRDGIAQIVQTAIDEELNAQLASGDRDVEAMFAALARSGQMGLLDVARKVRVLSWLSTFFADGSVNPVAIAKQYEDQMFDLNEAFNLSDQIYAAVVESQELIVPRDFGQENQMEPSQ